MKTTKRILSFLYYFFIFLVLHLGTILYVAALWSLKEFGEIPFAQIAYHIFNPVQGTGNEIVYDFIKICLPYTMIMFVIFIVFLIWDLGIIKFIRKKLNEMEKPNKLLNIICGQVVTKSIYTLMAIAFLIVVIRFDFRKLNIYQYIDDMNRSSYIYEEYYVDPKETKIVFPEKKKNLIYIYMESMEATYASTEFGGAMEGYNLIPNLTNIALDNTHFARESKDTIAGANQATNTTWTIAAMVGHSAGIPLTINLDLFDGNSYGAEKDMFLPGTTTIGDILDTEGYNQIFMCGSDIAFAGRDKFLSQHGNYELWDYNTAKETGKIPSDYEKFWGFEDEKLYEYAKEMLLDLANEQEPFNFTMLTVDTHHPDGYLYGDDEIVFDTQYKNVIYSADKRINEFVNWIQEQDFYEDTVIVIAGDHNSMSTEPKTYNLDYERNIYYAIINSDVEYINAEYRSYNSLDFFPTTLASIGVKIEGDRLGLGTNLFSDKKTLEEELGQEELYKQLSLYSFTYSNKISLDN